ncbi:hypothetical protein ACRRTK_021743 [Alexandromys fortis]
MIVEVTVVKIVGVEEVRVEEVGVEEVRMEEVRVEEVGVEEVRVEEVGVEEVRMEEVGVEEVRMEEVGVEEVRMEEVGVEEKPSSPQRSALPATSVLQTFSQAPAYGGKPQHGAGSDFNIKKQKPRETRSPTAAAAACSPLRKRKCTRGQACFQDGGPQGSGIRVRKAAPRVPRRPRQDRLPVASSSRVERRGQWDDFRLWVFAESDVCFVRLVYLVVVEIQEGKTTVVSIAALATHDLLNARSRLAAPLREGKRPNLDSWLQDLLPLRP